MDALTMAYSALWLLVLFHSLLLWRILRLFRPPAPIARPEHPIPRVGDPAPVFECPTLEGVPVRSREWVQRPTALLFLDPENPASAQILTALSELPKPFRQRFLVLCEGEQAACRALQALGGREALWLHDVEGEVRRQYGFLTAPGVAILDAHHRLHAWGWIPREDLERILQDLEGGRS